MIDGKELWYCWKKDSSKKGDPKLMKVVCSRRFVMAKMSPFQRFPKLYTHSLGLRVPASVGSESSEPRAAASSCGVESTAASSQPEYLSQHHTASDLAAVELPAILLGNEFYG